ncbi:hypothetical protein R3W88_011046 [Solanum pinnatisectum]|uniref:Ubiquitin-like protease family profile domain-containing protein n=1 Tax=Solanum pinnatisectum TaxID=50273 RepID=A0AAV9L5S4_9SOLN|nr:hypothetical protein R3W88_011046 [Solanum pinnatisectum]
MNFVVAFFRNKNWFYAISQKESKFHSPKKYRFTTVNWLFKTFINDAHTRYYCSPPDDNFSTQEHMARGPIVSAFKRSIKNIIKEFFIPAEYPWHLVDDVYISVNSDGKFHWVLAVVALKKRLIRVIVEIKKLDIMMPSYLHNNGFFNQLERTDWLSLDAYNDKQTGMLLGPQHEFEAEFVQDIMQQESDSFDGIPNSKNGFCSQYLCTRYGALLWKYGTEKAKAGYVSENDYPTRPKNHFTAPTEEDLINVE